MPSSLTWQRRKFSTRVVQIRSLRALHLPGAQFLFELALADDGPLDGAVPDNLAAVVRADFEGVEAAIERLQQRFGLDHGVDAGGRAVIDVDRRADTDLIAFAKRQQRVEARSLHPLDHVWRRQHRRLVFSPCREGVLELDPLLYLSARAD